MAIDPTKTATLRKRFERDAVKRFRELRRRIAKLIITEYQKPELIGNVFEFPTSEQKVQAFNGWLKQQMRAGEIAILPADDRVGVPAGAWANAYIDHSYQQGIRRARAELRAQGEFVPSFEGLPPGVSQVQAAFNQPFHLDRVGLIYNRVYSDLEGISREMDKQLTRVLADGMASGISPLEMAQNMLDRVDKIGIHRARLLARTEVIRAHHQANMQEYRNAGIAEVEVVGEWTTAGDSRVCPRCKKLDGKVFTLKAIENAIPLHPNCRCVAVPVLKDKINKGRITRREPRTIAPA